MLPGALATHMVMLIPGIQFSLGSNQRNSNMKIDPLPFIQCLLTGDKIYQCCFVSLKVRSDEMLMLLIIFVLIRRKTLARR